MPTDRGKGDMNARLSVPTERYQAELHQEIVAFGLCALPRTGPRHYLGAVHRAACRTLRANSRLERFTASDGPSPLPRSGPSGRQSTLRANSRLERFRRKESNLHRAVQSRRYCRSSSDRRDETKAATKRSGRHVFRSPAIRRTTHEARPRSRTGIDGFNGVISGIRRESFESCHRRESNPHAPLARRFSACRVSRSTTVTKCH